MTDTTPKQNPMFSTEVLYQLPYQGKIRRDVLYSRVSKAESLTMDIYYPAECDQLKPVVLFVTGYPDPAFKKKIGMKLKEVKQYTSWAKLVAASGIIALTYSNSDPEKDIFALLHYLKDSGKSLGIDANKIALWSCSGNVPTALSVLLSEQSIQCAALCYGYMLDLDGSNEVTTGSEAYKFANPNKNKNEFPEKVPMLITRVGQEECIGLNASIDRFVKKGLLCNAPINMINIPDGHHAFDLFDEVEESTMIIKLILNFFKFHLTC